jgi:hypothetical protein
MRAINPERKIMINAMTQSTQQRNADAWLVLKSSLDEYGIDYGTRTDYEGALWIECFGLEERYPSCRATIKIGPGVGVALVQSFGKRSVPESHRGYVRRMLAQVSLNCTLGSVKYDMDGGAILVETPILFIGSDLRPRDVLFALYRMTWFLEEIIEELRGVFERGKWMRQVQVTLDERARNLVQFEVDEPDNEIVINE